MGISNTQANVIVSDDDKAAASKPAYLEALTYVERLHRRLLDVIKDELDRVGCSEIHVLIVGRYVFV